MRSARGGSGLLQWPADTRLSLLWLWMLLLCGRLKSVVGVGNPPEIVEHAREYTFMIGKPLKLVCPIIGGKMVMYTWEKGEGNVIGEFHPRYKVLKRGRGRVLKSKKTIQKEDRGIYKCNGVNGFGRKTVSLIVNVFDPNAPMQPKQCAQVNGNFVKGAPCFIDMDQMKPDKISREMGQPVTMVCSAYGKDIQYSWKKIDSRTKGWLINTEGLDASLFTIRNLELVHAGRYMCTVKNSLGELSYQYTLSVRVSSSSQPTILGSPQRNTTVDFGQTAQLVCRVRSHSKPYIRWMKMLDPRKRSSYKNRMGQMDLADLKNNLYAVLKESGVSKDENDIYVSKMVIRKVSGSDIGEYMCVVFGGGSHTKNLIYQTTFLHIRNYRYTGQRDGDGSMSVNAANPFHLIVYIAVPLCVLVVCIGVIIYCLVTRHNSSMSGRGTTANSSGRMGSNSASGYVMKPYTGAQTKYTAQPVPQFEPYPLPNTNHPSSPPVCYPSYHSSSSNGYSASSSGPVPPGRAYNT